MSFVATPLIVAGRRVKAARAMAPIVGRAMRDLGDSAASIEDLMRCATPALVELGHSLMFGMPRRGFQRVLADTCGRFPLWTRPLPLEAPLPLGNGCRAEPLADWGTAVDELWCKAARLHRCTVVRDASTLRWKAARLEATAILRNGELVAIVASGLKGDKPTEWWEVGELLSVDFDRSLEAALRAVANLAHARAAEAPADRPIRHVALLVTPAMERAAAAVGFRRDAWDFPLMVRRLDATLSDEEIAPSQWYVTAND